MREVSVYVSEIGVDFCCGLFCELFIHVVCYDEKMICLDMKLEMCKQCKREVVRLRALLGCCLSKLLMVVMVRQ